MGRDFSEIRGKAMKKIMKIGKCSVAPLLAWLFPVLFLYFQNVKETAFREVFAPCGILLACGIVVFLLGLAIFRSLASASVFSLLLGILLGNFGLLLQWIHTWCLNVRYWHLMYVGVIVIVFLCVFLRKINFEKEVQSIAAIVLAGLIALNLITAAPTILQRISETSKQTQQNAQMAGESEDEKRNIYYLLCDEYASFAQMEQEFQFDNAEFKTAPQQLGFNISETSRNDCSETVVIMANMMQLDYVATTSSTSVELEDLTKNGRLQEILTEQGYTLRGVGNTEWLGIEGSVESSDGAKTADGTSLTLLALKKSFLYPFAEPNRAEQAQAIVQSFDDLNSMAIDPNSGVFTMFYVSAPHQPYFLDKNGNVTTPDKWANDDSGSNDDAYLGMVMYVNKRVVPAVTRIVEQDPDAVIVLCSDHGNRFGVVTEEMKSRILNVVYYGGEEITEFEGMSGVNTLRYILNREFGMALDYIPLPG